jgi:hypothetical protein
MIATAVPGSSKYGKSKNSFVDFSAMNIPATVAADLAEMGSHSLADKTWSTYTTAERML